MSRAPHRSGLPAEIETLIRCVLDAAGLDLVDGREDVAKELRAHFEDGLGTGATPEELIGRFGDPAAAGHRISRTRPRAAARERGETGRWWMSVGEWWNEVRMAVRRLGRAPGFSAIVVLTLGLGVGANTAIFTVLNAVLLQELPYPEPDRLVRIYESDEAWPDRVEYMRAPAVVEYRTWNDVFEEVGTLYTYREQGADLTDGDVPRRVNLLQVSAGYFEALGISPAMGRTFREDESFGAGEFESRGTPIDMVALLSHNLWQTQFGADPEILGKGVRLDDAAFEVVGVMPRGFRDPFGTPADVWIPQDLRPGGSNSFGNYYLSAVARLREDLTIETAQQRLRLLSEGFADAEPEMEGAFPKIFPLQSDVVGETRQSMLWILAGAALLVLLTACVNVANLLFARGLGQDRSFALRSALGSGRTRLIAAILTENGLLAALGGIAGLALGWLGVEALLLVSPDALPTISRVQVDGDVFLFALAATVGSLLLFGLAPALRLSRVAPAEVLRSGDRASTVGRFVRKLRDGLVVVQVAAALVLVAGATLLTRSFNSLVDVPLGVEADGVLTFEVHLPTARYVDREARDAFHVEFHDRVSELPGVRSVGATSWLPINGRYHTWGLNWSPGDDPGADDAGWHTTDVRMISGDYFGTMGIEIIRGDDFADIDLEAEQVAWLNQTVVDQVFGDVDALGERILLANEVRRVAGIVEDIPFTARGEVSPKSYVPHIQADSRNWALIQTVRADGDLGALQARVVEELRMVDPQLVLFRPRTFESVLGAVRAQDRFATLLMGAFAALALLLSVLGTYGVLATSVAGRSREIGIRVALGADTASVRAMILKYAAALTIPGILLGLAGAWVASRWIEELLFEVGGGDPMAYVGAAILFLMVGLLSGWLPARRATRVDTVQTLTAE